MWETIKGWWQWLRDWCRDSETIGWARLQLVVGAIWTALVQTDLAPLLDARWLSIWLIVSGAVTELLRRSRATDL